MDNTENSNRKNERQDAILKIPKPPKLTENEILSSQRNSYLKKLGIESKTYIIYNSINYEIESELLSRKSERSSQSRKTSFISSKTDLLNTQNHSIDLFE
jgi:hypothetical protein